MWGSLALCVLAVIAVASTGAIFKPGPWYETLAKPTWTPPDWAFPVVWSILYLFIAIAGWLVWREAGWSLPIAIWLAQLLLNGAWVMAVLRTQAHGSSLCRRHPSLARHCDLYRHRLAIVDNRSAFVSSLPRLGEHRRRA